MKIVKYLIPRSIIFSFLSLTVIGLAGCQEDDILNKLQTSIQSHTFKSDNPEDLTIEIISNMNWDAEIKGDWITEKSRNERFLTVVATNNDTRSDREATIVISSDDGKASETIKLSQYARPTPMEPQPKGVVFREMVTENAVMSKDGSYIAYVKDNIYTSTRQIVLIDVASDKEVVYENQFSPDLRIIAVDETGQIIIDGNDGSPTFFFKDGKMTELPKYNGRYITIRDASIDGSVLLGSINGANFVDYPVRIVNGEVELLEVSDTDVFGTPLVQGEYWMGVNGFGTRGCSYDGSNYYGSCRTCFAPVAWKKSGEMYFPGKETVVAKKTRVEGFDEDFNMIYFDVTYGDKPFMMGQFNPSMSHNGRYFGSTYLKNGDEGGILGDIYPAIYDFETDSYDILEIQGTGLFATDDGRLFVGQSDSGGGQPIRGTIYDSVTGQSTAAGVWIKEKFNYTYFANNVIPCSMSKDGNVVLALTPVNVGYGYIYLYCYFAKIE